MRKNKENKTKAGAYLGLGIFATFIVCALLIVANTGNVIIDDSIDVEYETRTGPYKIIPAMWLGDNDPGAGASGVMEVHVNATNTSTTPYSSNLTGAYESGEVNNSHIGSDVPYETAFDVIIEVRFNKTHAWDVTWNLSLVRAYANSTVLGVDSIEMVEQQIATSADYLYVSYFLRDADGGAGSGFTISRGQNVTSFSVNFESLFS